MTVGELIQAYRHYQAVRVHYRDFGRIWEMAPPAGRNCKQDVDKYPDHATVRYCGITWICRALYEEPVYDISENEHITE